MACGGFGAPDISRENRLKNQKNRFMRDPDSRVPAASQQQEFHTGTGSTCPDTR